MTESAIKINGFPPIILVIFAPAEGDPTPPQAIDLKGWHDSRGIVPML
jgi:hypothetical protein